MEHHRRNCPERREILDWYHFEFAQGSEAFEELKPCSGKGKLMRQRLCLLIAPLNKLRILSTTSTL